MFNCFFKEIFFSFNKLRIELNSSRTFCDTSKGDNLCFTQISSTLICSQINWCNNGEFSNYNICNDVDESWFFNGKIGIYPLVDRKAAPN